MENNIKVSPSIIDSLTKMNIVMKDFYDLETEFKELENKISDESKWAGAAQQKALSIHKLIMEYEKSLCPIYEAYQKEISNLEMSVDEFMFNSNQVNLLKVW